MTSTLCWRSIEFSGLRATDHVVANPRLSKHQLIRGGGIEFDIYVEQQHHLLVP